MATWLTAGGRWLMGSWIWEESAQWGLLVCSAVTPCSRLILSSHFYELLKRASWNSPIYGHPVCQSAIVETHRWQLEHWLWPLGGRNFQSPSSQGRAAAPSSEEPGEKAPGRPGGQSLPRGLPSWPHGRCWPTAACVQSLSPESVWPFIAGLLLERQRRLHYTR